MKNIFILAVLLVTFTGCIFDDMAVMDYQKKEAAAIEANAIAVMDALGYSGYKVFVFPHAGYNPPANSQSFENEKFDGESYIPEGPPEGPPDGDQDVPPGWNLFDNENFSSYSKEKSIQNFQEEKDHAYRVNYFSLLVVFDTLEPGKANQIKDILKKTVMDFMRGDNVVIEAKETKSK